MAVTRANRPSVSIKNTIRAATCTAHNRAGDSIQYKKLQEKFFPSESWLKRAAVSALSQLSGPKKAVRLIDQTACVYSSIAPPQIRMSASVCGSAGLNQNSFQPRTTLRPQSLNGFTSEL